MTIGKILQWFYCLKVSEAICLLLGAAVLFCWTERKLDRKCWWKPSVAFLLAALAAAILYCTLGRSGGGEYQINLIPFHSYRAVKAGANPELYRSNFMNAAMFYPAGLLLTSLLPKKWPVWVRCLLAVLLLGAMSGGIEYAQYRYSLGQVEIDDVIHNVTGALVGGLALPIFSALINVAEKWIQEQKPK